MQKVFVEFYEKIKEREYKKIDILVTNAGITAQQIFYDQTDDEWDSVIRDKSHWRISGTVPKHLLGLLIQGRKNHYHIGSLSGEYGGPRTPSYAHGSKNGH